ncbi:MAG TPA: PilZ domain-containing protein [Candidatus Acidoferrum sp.]|jgi:hypothetical protein
MSQLMSNRRKAPRYPLILVAEVTILPDGPKLTARTSDLSRTGCYIDILKPPSKGSLVFLRLLKAGEIFEITATAVYVSPGLGMGIEFPESIPPHQLEILDRWLEAVGHPMPAKALQ